MKTLLHLVVILSAAGFLAACAALPEPLTPPQPYPTPTRQPIPTSKPVSTLPAPVLTPPTGGDEMPRFLIAARQALAKKLNLPFEQIEVMGLTQTDWPNACLGLPEPGEMCAEVITPGYRVMLRANQQTYEVHTGGNNQSARIAPQPGGAIHPIGEKARAELAKALGVPLETIKVLEVEEKIWPDSCLGISRPNLQCLQVLTPGYQVKLEVQGKVYIYHTNQNGTALVLASTSTQGNGGAPAEPVLSWKSSGGDCQSALISSSTISFGLCDKPRLNMPWSNAEHKANYKFFTTTYRTFSAVTKAGSLQFTGSGVLQASPAEQRAIAEWVQLVVATASGNPGGTNNPLALSWRRDGGIAGFCDELLINRSGFATASSCKNTKPAAGFLQAGQLEQLYTWLDELKVVDVKFSDPAKADAMHTSLKLNGTGSGIASQTAQQSILLFAQDVFNQLSQAK